MKNQISASLNNDNEAHNQAQNVAFGITAFGGKVHENITKEAIRRADMTYGRLIDGVKWPDAPDDDDSKKPNWESYAKLITQIKTPGTITNKSHFGEYQIWHSMTPDDGTGRIYTNGEVKELIINKAVSWYENAQKSKDTFDLGKVLHMVQDSYSRSHVSRDENGRIKNFQSYNAQDAHEHGTADKPLIETVIDSNGMERQVPQDWKTIPGTLQALEASTAILKLYKSGANSMELAKYLRNHVYEFESEQTKDLPAGGTDPQYAPKPNTRIAENQTEPQTQMVSATQQSEPDNAHSNVTLRELLTQHHGADNAEKIIAYMQMNLIGKLHQQNSEVHAQVAV